MPSTIRSFIAARIPCTPPLRPILRELRDMGNAIKSTDPDELHLTLKFLGDIRWEQTAEIAKRLKSVAAGIPQFTTMLQGIGAFPDAARPNVVWAGVESKRSFERLASDLEDQLAELGFLPEARNFHPHITLARIKAAVPRGLSEWISGLSQRDFGSADLKEIELFQSELASAGPSYTSLATARLGR